MAPPRGPAAARLGSAPTPGAGLPHPRTRIRTSLVAFVVALVVSCVMALQASDTVQGDERGFLYYGTMQA